MADDNWSAKTHSTQFQAKETSNQSNCVVSTLSNDDLTLTKWSFSATIHQSHSLARSLPLTHLRHLTSFQRNATQSIIQSDIDLGLHSLIHTLLHSLIHSHNFTHPLPHLIVHAFHHSPTDLLVHSSPRPKIHSLTQLFIPSRNNPIIHSLPYSFKYARIIHFSIHSPNNKLIKANIFFIHCDYVYYKWRLIDKCLASVRPPQHCLLWGEPPVSD